MSGMDEAAGGVESARRRRSTKKATNIFIPENETSYKNYYLAISLCVSFGSDNLAQNGLVIAHRLFATGMHLGMHQFFKMSISYKYSKVQYECPTM